MAIYRGPGGAGDATVDATNNAALVAIRTQQATDAATAAAASAAEAAASAVIASDGLDGIAAYAAAAAGSAADALTSETNAATSEANANEDAGTASTKADEAAASAAAAAASASSASSSASSASTSASNASTSASNASSSASSASSSAASAANSASDAAVSASLANGYLPSFTGNNGKYLKTNGTNALWEAITDVAAATITNDGVLFGFTDESTLQSTTTYTYNSTIYPQTPQNIVSGDGPAGHVAQTMAQAIINGDIVVGDPIKVTALKVSTNVVEEINLGTVSACSGLYNGLTSRWEFSITTTNPNSWNSSGYYNPGPGIYLYTIISGPISYGDENTQLGYNAGSGLTLGTKNVIIGSRSATNLGNGSNNIIIGQGAQGSAVDINNEITLGNSTHTKTRLFGALAVGGSATGTSGQVLTSNGSGSAPSWTTLSSGTVTSVALSVPTGLTVSGSPVTTSGTLALTYTAGYSIPTTSSQTNWDTAYGWGNHASAGYLTGITSGQVTGALGYTPENAANKNAANGYAGLDSSGLVPSSILPSYVDDVLEYANLASFPGTGATGKIYVALDTNKTYRWSGSAYIEISASPGSTDAVTEGSTNLYFTDARARAAVSATGSLSYNSSTGVFSYTQPTNVSTFTNDSGYITSSALSPYLTSATAASTYAPLTGTGTSGTWGISVTGTAANITATSNSTLTTLSALSLPGSQVSGNISGNAANVTGTVAIANGGTGATTAANALTSLGAYPSSNPSGYTSNTGTVTSVGGTGTVSGLTLSGTVTTSGNLTLGGTLSVTPSNFASQTANTFLAAPNGAAGTPTFRALVAADVPTLNQNTTGTAANVTGTVAVANGGTGLTTTPANGALDIGNGTGFTRTTLTAGSNITITNGAGSITIAATGGGASAATPTALGTVYGKMTTSGASPYLTALGYNAGNSTTGVHTTVVGYNVLNTNTTGTYNTGVGSQALASATGSRNTAVGATVMRVTTGSENIGIGTEEAGGGYSPLWSNTSGAYNIAVGNGALGKNTTSSNNTAVGHQSLYNNTTGLYNVAIGYQAAFTNNGGGIVAIGNGALYSNTTGTSNIAIGSTYNTTSPLYNNTTGSLNVAVGEGALKSNTTSSYGAAVGYQAAFNSTGHGNTCFGYTAGSNITSGAWNVVLGPSTSVNAATDVNSIILATAAGGASVAGKGSNTAFISAAGGSTYNGANTTTFATTSDQRIKKNIVDLGDSLSKINSLRPVEFDYKETDKHEIGFIAQEYEVLFPDQITLHAPSEAEKEWVGDDQVKAIQQNLVPYLVKAIQELNAKVESQAAEIAALKGSQA